jgi:hypothetical protein
MKHPFACLLVIGLFAPSLRAQTTTTAPSESAAIKQALESFAFATINGDASAMRAQMDYHGPLQIQLADAMIQCAQAQAHLRKAAQKAFPGQDLTPLVWGTPDQVRGQLDAATITIEGADATVTFQGNSLHMVRVNGQWKEAVVHALDDWSPNNVHEMRRSLNHQADIYNALADEVATDKYHTPRQAAEILRQELLKPATRPATQPTQKQKNSE